MAISPRDSANDADWTRLGVRDCEALPVGFPEHWRRAATQIGVGLVLTENNCLYRGFFDEFAVTSLQAAVNRLKEGEGAFLCYNVFFTGSSIVPNFRFDVDSPLLEDHPLKAIRREPVQADEPWSWCWDRTLLELRNEPLDDPLGLPLITEADLEHLAELEDIYRPYEGTIYLRVGGASQREAIANWQACAASLRPLFFDRLTR